MLLGACISAAPRAEADELTIIVMPMEHLRPECEPFDRNSFASRFPNLAIDNNSEDEWRELRIGNHCWLCGEVEELARKAGQRIHIRFVPWQHALGNLTARYAKECAVLQVPSTWTAALIDKGLLAPYEHQAFDPNDYPAGALDSCRGSDEQTYYAVPWHVDFRVLYFRDALTRDSQELVDYPKFRESLLRRQAAMHEQPDGLWQAPMGLGRTRDWDVLHNTLNWAFGGRILEKRGGRWRAVFHEGDPYDGLSKLCQLTQENLVRFFAADMAHGEQEWQILAEKLRQGEVDAVIGGPYMRVRFADRMDIHPAPLPRMVEGRDHTFLGGSHLGFTAKAQDRGKAALAREVIARLTSFEAGVALYENTDAMPARKDAFEQFLEDPKNSQWREFERAFESAQPYPSLPQWAEVMEEDTTLGFFHNVVASIARGHEWKDVAPLLITAAEEINRRLPSAAPTGWERAWKWLSDHGINLLIVGVLVVVAGMLWKLARRSPVDVVLQQMDDALRLLVDGVNQTGEDIIVKINPVLYQLKVDIEDFRQVSLTAIEARTRFEAIETGVGEAAADIAQVGKKHAQDQDTMRGVLGKMHELVAAVGALSEKVQPQQPGPPLGECDLRAEVGYDFEKHDVTLTLSLVHGQSVLLSPRRWNGYRARLFEAAALRHCALKRSSSPVLASINPSDYLLVRQDVPGMSGADTALDTACRLITRFRGEICTFLRLRCQLLDRDGQAVEPKHVILRHCDDDGMPCYLFVPHEQAGAFTCDLDECEAKVDQSRDNPDGLCQILTEHPRSWTAWHALADCLQGNHGNLSERSRDFLCTSLKPMIKDEAKRFGTAKTQCGAALDHFDPEAKSYLQANGREHPFVLSLRSGSEFFGGCAAKLVEIVSHL